MEPPEYNGKQEPTAFTDVCCNSSAGTNNPGLPSNIPVQTSPCPAPAAGYAPVHPQIYPAPVMQTYYPIPPQQQQQQQSTVVVNPGNQPPAAFVAVPTQSYCAHQAFACLVLWFCNILFGFIAWILALVADCTSDSDSKGARRLGRASIGMSVSGIIVTVIVVAIVLGVSLGTDNNTKSTVSVCIGYKVYDKCYSGRRQASTSCTFLGISLCCKSTEIYYEDYCYTL